MDKFELEWKEYCASRGGGAVTINLKDMAQHFAKFGYEQAINDALHKVKFLQERYSAIVPKDHTQDCFKTARLIGYNDMKNYLEKLNLNNERI